MDEMLREWRREMKEAIEKIKGTMGTKEDLRRVKEELEEELKTQSLAVRREVEEMREEVRELKNREERWQKERKEMIRKMEDLEKKVREIGRRRGGGKGGGEEARE